MSLNASLVRVVVIGILLTVVIELFFEPQFSPSPYVTALVVFGMQIGALAFASWLTQPGKRRSTVRLLFAIFLEALLIDFVLNPKNNPGLAWDYIAVLVIEVFGLLAARALTRQISSSRR